MMLMSFLMMMLFLILLIIFMFAESSHQSSKSGNQEQKQPYKHLENVSGGVQSNLAPIFKELLSCERSIRNKTTNKRGCK